MWVWRQMKVEKLSLLWSLEKVPQWMMGVYIQVVNTISRTWVRSWWLVTGRQAQSRTESTTLISQSMHSTLLMMAWTNSMLQRPQATLTRLDRNEWSQHPMVMLMPQILEPPTWEISILSEMNTEESQVSWILERESPTKVITLSRRAQTTTCCKKPDSMALIPKSSNKTWDLTKTILQWGVRDAISSSMQMS